MDVNAVFICPAHVQIFSIFYKDTDGMSMVFLIFLKHVGKFFVVLISDTAPAHFDKGDCFFTRTEQIAQILTVLRMSSNCPVSSPSTSYNARYFPSSSSM